jgi:hypothetical protein
LVTVSTPFKRLVSRFLGMKPATDSLDLGRAGIAARDDGRIGRLGGVSHHISGHFYRIPQSRPITIHGIARPSVSEVSWITITTMFCPEMGLVTVRHNSCIPKRSGGVGNSRFAHRITEDGEHA